MFYVASTNLSLATKETHAFMPKAWIGATSGHRTRNLLLGKQALCQLSYSRMWKKTVLSLG